MKFVGKIFKNIRKIKLHTLILLILLLIFTTYAWFVFVSEVSSGLTAHVSSWSVSFKIDDEEVHDVAIDVGQIYPGMPNYEKTITIENKGELPGEISYEMTKVILLGTTYEVSSTLTSDDLISKMQNDYPFKVNVTISGGNIIPPNGTKDVTITVTWPFESGNDTEDEIDTQWGESAYDYYKTHGTGSPALHIDMTLKVDQKYN